MFVNDGNSVTDTQKSENPALFNTYLKFSKIKKNIIRHQFDAILYN